MRLMGLEASKAIHQIKVCESGKANISWIGWTRNRGRKSSAQATQNGSTTWQQLEALQLDAADTKSGMDLPRELTFLEVETSLPKLSPLPASGGSG